MKGREKGTAAVVFTASLALMTVAGLAFVNNVVALVRWWKAFLICPDAALPISRVCHDPETMQKVYDIGRAIAERLLPRVKAYIGQGAHKGG